MGGRGCHRAGQEDDGKWDDAVEAVDEVLGVEEDPVKKLRREQLRRDMKARGENLEDDGCAAARSPRGGAAGAIPAAKKTPSESRRAYRPLRAPMSRGT